MSHNRPELNEEVIKAQYAADLQSGVGRSNRHESAENMSPGRRVLSTISRSCRVCCISVRA